MIYPDIVGFGFCHLSLIFFVRLTPKEGQGIYRTKRCGNNNKDEDNCLKTLNDKISKSIKCYAKMFMFSFYKLIFKNKKIKIHNKKSITNVSFK